MADFEMPPEDLSHVVVDGSVLITERRMNGSRVEVHVGRRSCPYAYVCVRVGVCVKGDDHKSKRRHCRGKPSYCVIRGNGGRLRSWRGKGGAGWQGEN